MHVFFVFFLMLWETRKGNENNKYGSYAKHFPNEAFYTMYNVLCSPPVSIFYTRLQINLHAETLKMGCGVMEKKKNNPLKTHFSCGFLSLKTANKPQEEMNLNIKWV